MPLRGKYNNTNKSKKEKDLRVCVKGKDFEKRDSEVGQRKTDTHTLNDRFDFVLEKWNSITGQSVAGSDRVRQAVRESLNEFSCEQIVLAIEKYQRYKSGNAFFWDLDLSVTAFFRRCEKVAYFLEATDESMMVWERKKRVVANESGKIETNSVVTSGEDKVRFKTFDAFARCKESADE